MLIVEDDAVFARTLARSFERRGYEVRHAASLAELDVSLSDHVPGYAVVDLRLGHESGLACVARLHAHSETMRIVVLTGFASIATAVEAVKLGAVNYLAKPANTDEIEQALQAPATGNPALGADTRPSSLRTVEWEHIHQALADANFNLSEAARRLGLHRRTLVRKLGKRHL